MTHTLEIDFARAEGAVLRLIGLVERKGYDVRGIDMRDSGDGPARLNLSVSPRDSGRRIEVLSRHVEKVFGVSAVRRPDLQPSCLTRTLERAS